jgi:hypothetical protein
MTALQKIACGALQIECRIPCHDEQLAAVVWLLGQITGVTNCATIKAGADSLMCLQRQELMPAVIWQLMQILNQGGGMGPPGPPGPVLNFSGNYGGAAPPFTPTLSVGQMAFAYDTSTNTPWYFPYGNTQWQN